jgi:hypothetical protein
MSFFYWMPRILTAGQEAAVRIWKLLNRMHFARCKIVAAIVMKSQVFWHGMLC